MSVSLQSAHVQKGNECFQIPRHNQFGNILPHWLIKGLGFCKQRWPLEHNFCVFPVVIAHMTSPTQACSSHFTFHLSRDWSAVEPETRPSPWRLTQPTRQKQKRNRKGSISGRLRVRVKTLIFHCFSKTHHERVALGFIMTLGSLNSRCLKLHRAYSILFNSSNVGNFFGVEFEMTV